MKPNFTLTMVCWHFESTLVNRDLDKPAYLAPLYGSDLSPTENNYNNFSPSLGFAWSCLAKTPLCAQAPASTGIRNSFGAGSRSVR